MTTGRTRASILAAALLIVALIAPPAHAVLSSSEIKCFQSIAKASQNFVKAKLKVLQKCKNANLKSASCPMPDVAAITKLEGKLAAALDKGCPLTPANFAEMGFPAPCPDPNSGDGFTLSDLKACIKDSHANIVSEMMDLEYDASVTSLPASADQKCQSEVAKQSAALSVCVLKNVSKCRNDVLKGKLLNVPPDLCATLNAKTHDAIQKCQTKLTAGIAKKCTAPQVTSLKICTPDKTDAGTAASCEIAMHTELTDGPDITVPADLIDYEYAVFAERGICGDNIVNTLSEECDGTDDSACPGQCGTAVTPDGFFACLCKTKPRMVIAEHADADTDNGWLGLSVDGDVVEGGGYIIDLYDCDMTGLCNAGPSCSLPPHSPCNVLEEAANGTTSDSICAGLGQGTCRKERTATGPHCYQDINKKCSLTSVLDNYAICNAPGDFCVTAFHGAPVAAAAGGVSVCNVSVFKEDVVGTVNLTTGESSLKVRQGATTRLAITGDKPCPICGGFCDVSRAKCSVDADCNGQGPCITAAICSDGSRKDKACRRTPPFGGPIPFFGTTSSDCPPDTQAITDPPGLDINANPRTTGSVTLPPTFPCSNIGSSNNRCVGGSSEGRVCTTASECPGGTCNPQCFCSGEIKPNGCNDACVGGGADMESCSADSDCPGGFCHPSDCRVDPSDTDSNQEGICTAGPSEKFCSVTTYHSCSNNAQCAPPLCPDCGMGETCGSRTRACFVNSGITRIGTPGTPERETASVYCVPSNNPAINGTAGFPGPGALIQREFVIQVP